MKLLRYGPKGKEKPGILDKAGKIRGPVKGARLLQWSHSQYGLAIPRASLMKARLLTPPLITAILAKGYQPRWHPSATTVNIW
jgi:hypothetical protein